MCEIFDKICCHQPKARLVASKFSTIVLGGTAALHASRAWGAVLFADEVDAFFVLVLLILLVLLLDYSLNETTNAQRPTLHAEISNLGPNFVADRFYARCAVHRCNHRDYLFADRKLAGTDGPSEHSRIGAHRKKFAHGFYRYRALAAAHHDQQPGLHGTNQASERTGGFVTPD
jgi:hypothetical protein